jgi:hypothetical protein
MVRLGLEVAGDELDSEDAVADLFPATTCTMPWTSTTRMAFPRIAPPR